MLKFAYNTNGFHNHTLEDAISILSDLGYDGISITLDVHHLPPFQSSSVDIARIKKSLSRGGLEATIETGGRYVLDPLKKHHPTLLSRKGSEKRLAFLKRAIDIAADLEAPLVSFWSGQLEEGPKDEAMLRLAKAIEDLNEHAQARQVQLAFEPEPGMLIEGIADYHRLSDLLPHMSLPLTLDVGHLLLTEDRPPSHFLYQEKERLINVHIEDMKRGVHEHLLFGDGDMNFPPILAALVDIAFSGLVSIELSRSSHEAPSVAKHAIEFLRSQAPPQQK